ncbi:MAG: hypothetical protein HUJ52_00715, partial [Malacoplasma sp.]|nr:hypothetical protein [Malacoplasma sp.]
MKKTKKLILGALGVASTTLLATPLITSCSTTNDLKIVDRGDEETYASYKFGDVENKINFEDVLSKACSTSDGFAAFKQQIAKELIYNWYQAIKDSTKAPQSFKDNWTTWTDDSTKAYDDKVQSYKDSHGKTWEYYFQNEVLDPVGGTKDAFIRQQMYDKAYDAFKNLVFTNNYLAYTADTNPTVNSNISSFNKSNFENSATWKNINFYAKANTSYREGQDLDDIYAIIQRLTFDMYTEAKHPQALLMALWKYAAPDGGMYKIYSSNIPSSDEESKTNSSTKAVSDDPEPEPEPTKTLKAKYETPAFPLWNGGAYNANAKFQRMVTDFFIDNSEQGVGGGQLYSLDENGMFRYLNQGSTYQDDGSTMGFVLNMNDMYSTLDTWFNPAVSQLYTNYANGTKTDKFLDYPVSKLVVNASYTGNAGYTDLLSNFFFRAADARTTELNAVKTLATNGYALDLSTVFESTGTGATFHSSIFLNSADAVGDYYGYNNATEGGVQYVVNALWLTDDAGNRLPYILFRDTNGVHMCGLYGAVGYDGTTQQDGFLAVAKHADNDNTEPYSQARQNIQLKALNLFMKSRNESLFDVTSELKSYFTSNVDDVIIKMALNKTTRTGEVATGDKEPIFDLENTVESDIISNLEEVLSDSTIYFLLQNSLSTYLEANKKLYELVSTKISNSLLARSAAATLNKKTTSNYQNGVATPLPYVATYKNAEANTDMYSGSLTFDIAKAGVWLNVDSNEKIVDIKEDVMDDSIILNDTDEATTFLQQGVDSIVEKFKAIITKLELSKAVLPSSDYANWSEHLNPQYTYNADKATNAVGNALYMAINKFLSGTDISNSIKLDANRAYASSSKASDKEKIVTYDAKKSITDSTNNYGLGEIKNDKTVSKQFQGLKDAVAGMMYSNKVFTSDAPLTRYTDSTTTMNQTGYTDLVSRLSQQQAAKNYTQSAYNDDLTSYWTFVDTLQYLINDDYKNLMEYLRTSVVSYGTEADLVWVAKDNIDANTTFRADTAIATTYGWQQNYLGKYSQTYLKTTSGSTQNPTSYSENDVYFQAAPLTYDNAGTNATILGMGFAGLVTSASAPSAITSSLQDAIFTDTYNTKTDSTKADHFGGWNKYVSYPRLIEFIDNLASTADIQKLATNLGAANEDQDFMSKVVDIVNRTTFQDGDPEIEAEGTIYKSTYAVPPSVMKARLLGGKQTFDGITVDYSEKEWGLASYCLQDDTKAYDETTNPVIDEAKDLFAKYGEKGVAKELYDKNSSSHAMRATADSETAGEYAKMMVIQLNVDDFKDVESLLKAISVETSGAYDYTLLNYIAVQYAQLSS